MRGVMQWLHENVLSKLRLWGKMFALGVRWVREKGARGVDSVADPVLFVGFWFFAWLAYDTYSGMEALPKDEAARTLEWLKFYAYVVGGIVLIWQVRIANRRATALERTAALGEKGNITERFKNAIEHLGSASLSTHIGGVYTLYHVARESQEYNIAVAKILGAHLREITKDLKSSAQDNPSIEVNAILDVLFPDQASLAMEWAFPFGSVDISGAKLGGANLHLRNMMGVKADGAQFHMANLSYAWLLEASLGKAVFVGANLRHSSFREVVLIGANFQHANMRNADFHLARIFGTDFSKANMTDADFSVLRTIIIDRDISRLREFSEQRIKPTVKFNRAICVRTDFEHSDLSIADFTDADLREANLTNAQITAEQLLKAKTLHEAQLDDHIREEILRHKPELLDPPTDSPDEEE